ncbi:MAG: hypothetical protein CFE26_08155 [Verrucomicrobiales bacterium VVV1]|nr:MAG: hypothetical protein CFE26_08155 [Verrucomicrobiales bacterium VVV1]
MKAGKIALILFALLGLGINLLLLFWKLTDPANGIAGCGATGGCNEVLASKWSQVFGLPVTLPGALVYALILLSLRPRFERLLSPSLAVLTGGVIWFVSVQLWILHHLCPWCLAAHAIGVIVVALGVVRVQRPFLQPMIVGVVATGLLIAAQVFGPAPTTHRIEETTAANVSAPIHARGDGRKVEFNNGRKIYDRDALPRIGSTKAPHVLVEYFDYRCAACRTMHGFLDSLIGKHPDQIAIIMLPLEGADQHERPGSTSLSRIALAVWRTEPAKFPEIHLVSRTRGRRSDETRRQHHFARATRRCPQGSLDRRTPRSQCRGPDFVLKKDPPASQAPRQRHAPRPRPALQRGRLHPRDGAGAGAFALRSFGGVNSEKALRGVAEGRGVADDEGGR